MLSFNRCFCDVEQRSMRWAVNHLSSSASAHLSSPASSPASRRGAGGSKGRGAPGGARARPKHRAGPRERPGWARARRGAGKGRAGGPAAGASDRARPRGLRAWRGAARCASAAPELRKRPGEEPRPGAGREASRPASWRAARPTPSALPGGLSAPPPAPGSGWGCSCPPAPEPRAPVHPLGPAPGRRFILSARPPEPRPRGRIWPRVTPLLPRLTRPPPPGREPRGPPGRGQRQPRSPSTWAGRPSRPSPLPWCWQMAATGGNQLCLVPSRPTLFHPISSDSIPSHLRWAEPALTVPSPGAAGGDHSATGGGTGC